MNLLVPYVKLHPEVAKLDAVFVDTSGPTAYWDLLAERWRQGKTFIVLEQDKVPEPGLLQQLWDCSRGWCSVSTPMRETIDSAPYPSLSCTKFGAALMARYPRLLEWVGELDLGYGKKEWSRLDLGISALLQTHWGPPHWHDGVVEHLHEEVA